MFEFDKVTEIMKEKSFEEAIAYMEKELGFPFPEGACLCESNSGRALVMLSCAVEGKETNDFVEAMNKALQHSEDDTGFLSAGIAKAMCSGNFVRR